VNQQDVSTRRQTQYMVLSIIVTPSIRPLIKSRIIDVANGAQVVQVPVDYRISNKFALFVGFSSCSYTRILYKKYTEICYFWGWGLAPAPDHNPIALRTEK